ncbi:MAG: hypothetical protein WC910_11725 [Bacteroidales bacterium]
MLYQLSGRVQLSLGGVSLKFIQATDMPSSHNFALTGDDHDGSLLCHHDGLNQQVDWASKKGNYLGKMGDAIEAIMTDDKRYDRTSQDSVPLQQADDVIKRYKPVGKKIKFWLIGNHELKLHRFGDLGKYMADGIDCPYGTYTSVVEVSDKYGPMYRIFASHGFGMIKSNAKDAEQQQGNMKAALKMKLREKRGDCVVQAMGHCFSDDTELLTSRGWKFWNEILEDEIVLTINPETNLSEWQKITGKYVYTNKYDEMIEASTKVANFKVTPDHRIIYYNSGNGAKKMKEMKARDLERLSRVMIPVAAKSSNTEYPLDDDMIQLIGWLISEGHFRPNGTISLFQNWGVKERISSVLDKLGIEYSTYQRRYKGRKFNDPRTGKEYETKDDCACFYMGKDESRFILPFISEKQIPRYAFKFSDRQFMVLLTALVDGDGHRNGESSWQYYSKDRSLLDAIQALCVSHGHSALLRQHAVCRNQEYLTINLNHERTAITNKGKAKPDGSVKRVPATTTVWCVSVPNGTLMVRRNGTPAFLGNTHKLIIVPPSGKLYLYTDENGKTKQGYLSSGDSTAQYIDPDQRWYVNTGSFLKLYNDDLDVSGYAEVKGFDPVNLGFPIIKVRDRKVVSIDPVIL